MAWDGPFLYRFVYFGKGIECAWSWLWRWFKEFELFGRDVFFSADTSEYGGDGCNVIREDWFGNGLVVFRVGELVHNFLLVKCGVLDDNTSSLIRGFNYNIKVVFKVFQCLYFWCCKVVGDEGLVGSWIGKVCLCCSVQIFKELSGI